MEESFEVNHFQVDGWSSEGSPDEVTSTVEIINMLNSGCLDGSQTGIYTHLQSFTVTFNHLQSFK